MVNADSPSLSTSGRAQVAPHLFEFAGRRVSVSAPLVDERTLVAFERRFFAKRVAPIAPTPDPRQRSQVPHEECEGSRLVQALVSGFDRVGLFAFHAAGLVAPTGSPGVLVLGRASSGKTTLASSLLKVGWRVASDDALMLDSLTLNCLAFRRTMEPQVGWRPDGTREKFAWDLAVDTPEQFAPQLTPRAIVFLGSRTTTSSTFVRLPEGEAFLCLLRVAARRLTPERIGLFRRLATCGPALLASCGLDVLSAPEAVSERLLSTIADPDHPGSVAA